MKKSIVALCLTTALGLSCAFGLAGCGKSNIRKVNEKEVYANIALTSAKSLADMNNAKSYLGEDVVNTKYELSNKDKEIVSKYIDMFSTLFDKNSIPKIENKKQTFDEKEYNFVLNCKLGDATFAMYYNEGKSVETTDIDEENEPDELEVKTKLAGVMVLTEGENVTKMDISGKKVVEKEGNEKEESVEFKTTLGTNYIKVKQSFELNSETGEQEITYKYTTNTAAGKETVKVSIENEPNDKNKQQLELSFESETVDGTETEREFTISKVEDNKFNLEIEEENSSAETENKVKYVVTINELGEKVFEIVK